MREDGRLLAIRRADNGTQEIHGGVLELDNPLAAALPAKRPAFTSRWDELTGAYGNTIRGIVTLLLHTSPPAAQNALQGSQQPSPDPLDELRDRTAEVYTTHLLDPLDGNGPHVRTYDGKHLAPSG